MVNLRRNGLIWVLLCFGVGSLWGTWNAARGTAWIDFRAVYAGTRCLIHQHNPYSVSDLAHEYLSEDGQRPQVVSPWAPPNASRLQFQSITLYVNMPSAFVVMAPFAALTWWPAIILWMLLTGFVFILAILLMWHVGASHSPRVATFLACMVGLNCESIFTGANAAGIVVGFCAIAVWCFLRNRMVWIGVLCLGLSLAVKPHDGGFVWLYFLLAGGAFRKRALQSAAVTAVIAIGVGLVGFACFAKLAARLERQSGHDLGARRHQRAGPSAVKDGSIYSIVDLQSVISLFRDDPRFYNTVSYVFCGALLLAGAIWTLRKRFSVPMAWLAIAAVVPLTLLINYHRLWDARLVMLAIPGCCMLCAKDGPLGKAAMVITSAAVLATGDISLVIYVSTVNSFPWTPHGIVATAADVVLLRPASVALLAMGLFYLWVYLRRISAQQDGSAQYGLGVLATTASFVAQKMGIRRVARFEATGRRITQHYYSEVG